MANRLAPILLQKQREVADLYHRLRENAHHPIATVLSGDVQPQGASPFKRALQSSTLSVIAEIKRKSPSKGNMAPITNPIHLAERYIAGGAHAISILTDHHFFGGHLDDLHQVAVSIQAHSIPIIRKDFIIDEIQIAEAYLAGASAVLCIVSALGKKTKALIQFAHTIGIEVLVEIHHHDELGIALECGADIIGINNRNLHTFEVDTNTAFDIVTAIPKGIVKVAESGIHDPVLAQQYYHAGFDAVLIGEALVTADNPEQFIRECRYG